MASTLVVAEGVPTTAAWRIAMNEVRRSQGRPTVLLLNGGSVPSGVLDEAETLDASPFVPVAERRIREGLPRLLHDFATVTGLLDLYHWRGRVSIFWFLPISEMSRFRTPLVDQLYQLALIDAALESSRFTAIVLLTSDEEFAGCVRRVAERRGVSSS